jgi:putative DNA-invertase from lambdoid prophage Rac
LRASPDAAPSRRSGRPRVTERQGFQARFGAILERLSKGEISRRRAAKELGIGYATLKRLLEADSHDREGAS